MIKADSPNLWEIRKNIGPMKTKAVIVYSLAWLACLVNVERNLTEIQIGVIANDVVEEYGYLKVEEVKYVLKQAAKTEKIFGRLDYNVVMGWFKTYASERAERCADISHNESIDEMNVPLLDSHSGMSFREYLDCLEDNAANGDLEAQTKLEAIKNMPKAVSEADKEELKKAEFKNWRMSQYLPNKRRNKKD